MHSSFSEDSRWEKKEPSVEVKLMAEESNHQVLDHIIQLSGEMA